MHSLTGPPTLHQFGAALYADVRLVDPGHGLQVDLILKSGLTRRVRVNADLLRLGRALQGRYQAGLTLRMTLYGQLKPSLSLIKLTRHATPIKHFSRTS